jgi:hypothetical protein
LAILVKQYGENREHSIKMVEAVLAAVRDINFEVVKAGLELAGQMLDNQILPGFVYTELVVHIFTFPRLLDAPFDEASGRILKELRPPFDSRISEAFSLYVLDRTRAISLFTRLVFVFQRCPEIDVLLPFSVLGRLAKLFETELMRPQARSQDQARYIRQIEGLLMPAVRIAITGKFDPIDLRQIANVFLRTLEKWRLIPDRIFEFFLKVGCLPFPTDLFRDAQKWVEQRCYPSLVACALEFLPVPDVLTSRDFISKTLRTLSEIQPWAGGEFRFLPKIIARILVVPEYYRTFWPVLDSIFLPNEKLGGDEFRDRRLIYLKSVIASETPFSKRGFLLDFWKRWTLSSWLVLVLIQAIDALPIAQQLDYLEFVITNAGSWMPELFLSSGALLSSRVIMNEVKIRLVEFLIPHLPEVPPHASQPFVETIRSEPFLKACELPALVGHALAERFGARVRVAETIRSLLGNTEVERFCQIGALCELLWRDDHLAFLVLLIRDGSALWGPLVACSHFLAESSGVMAEDLFSSLTSDIHSREVLGQLFLRALEQKQTRILSGLLAAFCKAGIAINQDLRAAAVDITDALECLDFSEPLPDVYVLPHNLNDLVFAKFLETEDIETIAAAGQFFLRQYAEADVLGLNFTNPAVAQMRSLLDGFRQRDSNDNIFAALTRFDGNEQPILDAARVDTHALEAIEQTTRAFFCERPNLRVFDAEWLITVQTAIRLLKKRDAEPLATLDCYVNPVYVNFINRLRCDRRPTVDSQEGSPTLVVSPLLRDLFSQIAGFTTHGFLIVSFMNLEAALRSPDSARDLRKWSVLVFSLFLASPSAAGARAVVASYAQVAKQPDLPLFVRCESSARILTVCRLARDFPEIISVVSSILSVIDDKKSFAVWCCQLFELSRVGWFSEACPRKTNDPIALEVELAAGTTPSMATAAEADKIASFKTFADGIFAFDFDSFSRGRRMELAARAFLSGRSDKASELLLLGVDPSQLENVVDFSEQIELRYCPGYRALKERLRALVDSVNRRAPFTFPTRMQFVEDIRVLTVQEGIRRTSETTVLLPVGTIHGNPQLLALQRSDAPHLSTTFSTLLVLFNHIMKLAYPTRFRSMGLSGGLAHPVGNYILYRLPKETSTAVDSRLLDRVLRVGRAEGFTLRRRLLRSFVAHACVRDLFSLPQRSEADTLVSTPMASFAPSVADFRIQTVGDGPAVFLSPALMEVFGPSGRGEAVLAVAAVAQGLAMNIESVRAFHEVVVLDAVRGEDACTQMIEGVDEIEAKMLRHSPPKLPAATGEDSKDWIEKVIAVVDSWTVMEIQEKGPAMESEEFPWF